MIDLLGDRMKELYENTTRYFLPKKTYVIIRIDGKNFSKYTKHFQKPFDKDMRDDMCATMEYLCRNISGTIFGYTQSDEITIVTTDLWSLKNAMWFGGNLQKICSVSASLATAKFNQLRRKREDTLLCSDNNGEQIMKKYAYYEPNEMELAIFDSRVFTIRDKIEVENCFIWRQKDALRNGISQISRSVFSHKELEGKNGTQKIEMLKEKNISPDDYPQYFLKGSVCYKMPKQKNTPIGLIEILDWEVLEAPIFTKDKSIFSLIPQS